MLRRVRKQEAITALRYDWLIRVGWGLASFSESQADSCVVITSFFGGWLVGGMTKVLGVSTTIESNCSSSAT